MAYMDRQQGLIFISYASPDRERVRQFYDHLASQGFDVWLDFLRIKPGQNWDFEIKRALEQSAIVLIFVSKSSVDRRGYAQREIKVALDKLNEKLADDIFIIPVLLDDDAVIPSQLRSLQVARATDERSIAQIEDAIRFQFSKIGSSLAELQHRAHITWTNTTHRESWEGLPGYEIELKRLVLNSELYPEISIVNDVLRGEMAKEILKIRATRLSQEPERFNYGQSKEQRAHVVDGYFRDPIITGRVMSLQFLFSWFFSGAAHGGGSLRTYSFVLTPLAWIRSLEDIFAEPMKALPVLQKLARSQIADRLREMDAEPDVEWIDSGTANWADFGAFTFGESAVDLYFQQYQVAAYVFGPQNAILPYSDIIKLMKPEYVSALEIENILWDTQRAKQFD